VYNYTAAAAAAAVTDTIKYSAVSSDGQLVRGMVYFDIAGKCLSAVLCLLLIGTSSMQ
jgi:hypothetical protein